MTHKMLLRRLPAGRSTAVAACALVLVFAVSVTPVSAEPAPATPDLASLNLQAFKGAAVIAVRVKRRAVIGRLCHLLSDEDEAKIRANAEAMLDDERSQLAPKDQAFAAAYLEGVVHGAFQSVDIADEINDAACKRFAAPDGQLDRVLTWKGRK